MGIEPTFEAWEAPVLPLNYARTHKILARYHNDIQWFLRTEFFNNVVSKWGGSDCIAFRVVAKTSNHRMKLNLNLIQVFLTDVFVLESV